MREGLAAGADAAEIERLKGELDAKEAEELNIHARYHVSGQDAENARALVRRHCRGDLEDDPDSTERPRLEERRTWPAELPEKTVAEANDAAAYAWREREPGASLETSKTHARVRAALDGGPSDLQVCACCDVMDVLVRDQDFLPTKVEQRPQKAPRDVVDEAFSGDGTTPDYATVFKEEKKNWWRRSWVSVASFSNTAFRDVIPRFREIYGEAATAILVEKLNERITFSAFYPTTYPWDHSKGRELPLEKSIKTILRQHYELKERVRELEGRLEG